MDSAVKMQQRISSLTGGIVIEARCITVHSYDILAINMHSHPVLPQTPVITNKISYLYCDYIAGSVLVLHRCTK